MLFDEFRNGRCFHGFREQLSKVNAEHSRDVQSVVEEHLLASALDVGDRLAGETDLGRESLLSEGAVPLGATARNLFPESEIEGIRRGAFSCRGFAGACHLPQCIAQMVARQTKCFRDKRKISGRAIDGLKPRGAIVSRTLHRCDFHKR